MQTAALGNGRGHNPDGVHAMNLPYAYERVEQVPLDLLDLSARLRKCLAGERCVTVGDALNYKDADLLRLPGFGITSLREWQVCVDLLRLKFQQRDNPKGKPDDSPAPAAADAEKLRDD